MLCIYIKYLQMTFRSLTMSHFLLVVPRDNAYDTMNEIAQQELVHFNDCGDPANRPFYLQLKRCDQNLQRIQTMKNALTSNGQEFEEYDELQPMFGSQLQKKWHEQAHQLDIQQVKLLDFYQEQILDHYNQHQDIMHRVEKLSATKKNLLQKIACYQTIESFFGENELKQESQEYFQRNLPEENLLQVSGISYIVGIVQPQAQLKIQRTIFRVSRGYACTKTLSNFKFQGLKDFNDRVILILFPTSDSQVLRRKIVRVVQTFCSNSMSLDEMKGSASRSLKSLITEFKQIEDYIHLNNKELSNFLSKIKSLECIEKWRTFLWKQKVIYENLNKMEVRSQFFTANIYLPQTQILNLSLKLNKISPAPTLQEVPNKNPPTAFSTNSYTAIAQQITDTYGVPRYQEINPTIFTTVTFPFFFGVMFGDIAHGGVLFALGIYLIFNDESIKKSSLRAFSSLRYMITMMGFFAFYCGWIYNDFIGFNLNIFGSCYDVPEPLSDDDQKNSEAKPFPNPSNCIYGFGIDPVWGRAENQLVYVNSLKMKLAVIIGVLHMVIGIGIKAFNSRFYKKKLDFYFEFVPQIIFMVILFGYMDFLIVFKWLKDWTKEGTQWAPSIITTMMNIGLELGTTTTQPNGGSNMWGDRGNTSQDIIQKVILVIAVICIPWMLLPKPIIEIKKQKKIKKQNPLVQEQDLEYQLEQKILVSHIESGEEHEDASEIFVHQLIETIEFVLGAISNTASYLRLWALSLAHSQLAKVFFQKTLQMGFGPKVFLSVPIMILGFYVLSWITFGILMCMDSMECFLHSLRLHWVEFQNKFYKGDGYAYHPVSLKKVVIDSKNR